MKRNTWNILIDTLSFVVFMAMISTGLIMKYVLPPGSGRLTGGQGRGKLIEIYVGLTRHEWGEIHFYISLAFLILLIVHLVLHWKWIQSTLWGTASHPVPVRRKVIAIAITLFILISLLFPWLGTKKSLSVVELRTMRTTQAQ